MHDDAMMMTSELSRLTAVPGSQFSPAGKEALASIKAFVRETVSLDAFEERALLLAGLPPADIDEGISAICRELAGYFVAGGFPEELRVGVAVALADILRDRIAELQAAGGRPRMSMVFNSFASFAAHLLTVEADVRLACDAAVVKACKLIAKTSKNMIGHEQPFWPGLKPETIAHKATGNSPLLETGRLRDSIEWSAPHHEWETTVGYVGTDDPNAKYHEYGTSRIPPRPFLSTAAMGREGQIHEIVGRLVFGAMAHGGPEYRELMEAFRILKHTAHMAKEMFDDDEDKGRK